MNGPVVTLDAVEMTVANVIAGMRQVQNLAYGRKDAHGADMANGLRLHLEGAAGEIAVAKFLGRYWNGAIGNMKAGDVGKVQVRATMRENGCLLLHPTDRDEDCFILAVGTAPSIRLAGWIRGRIGKQSQFWRDPKGGRPAFFVPQSSLRPMERAKGERSASPQMSEAPAVSPAEAPDRQKDVAL